MFSAFAAIALTLAGSIEKTHPGVDAFVDEVVAEHALDRSQVELLLSGATRQESILEAMRRPAEKRMTWHRYRKIFMTDKRINAGVAFVEGNRPLLEQVEERFQVPIPIIAGIIGVETHYGTITGNYRVIDALATLAFHYPPRARFFRSELEEFLLLGRDESLDLATIKGSYAGAMGMGQFIPSSYRAYAVDFDEDGSRDLWGSQEDAIASVANYLHVHHWHYGEPVVSRATVTGKQRVIKDPPIKPQYPVQQMIDWGYLPSSTQPPERLSTLLEMEGEKGVQHWLAFHNFYVITRYNRSPLYALAVYELSEAVQQRLSERASGP